MKKLIFTRFGIGVFDEGWYEHRLMLFKTMTLASFEHLENADDLRYFLIVDSDMPVSAKRNLRKIIDASSISSKIHIREIDYYYELIDKCREINREFCDEDEFAIIGRIDMDDALAKPTLKQVDDFAQMHKDESALVTFPDIYLFYLYERKLVKKNEPLHSMNTFWITDNRDYTPFDIYHLGQDKIAEERKVAFYYLSGFNSVYTRIVDSDGLNAFKGGEKRYYEGLARCKPEEFCDENYTELLKDKFGISGLNDYYTSFPELPRFGLSLDCNNNYSDVDGRIKSLLKQNKNEFIKYRQEKREPPTFFSHSFMQYYDMMSRWSDLKLKGKNIEDYLLKNGYKNIAIYGIGTLGQLLYNDLKGSKISIKYYIEKDRNSLFDNSLKGCKLADLLDAEPVDLILVTPIKQYNAIKYDIGKIGNEFNVMSLDKLVENMKTNMEEQI